MIVKKITSGFVIQYFETETEKFLSQKFIAGDEVWVKDLAGNSLDEDDVSEYLPFDMVQPS